MSKIDSRRKQVGTLFLTSLLEDLVFEVTRFGAGCEEASICLTS